MPTLQEQLQTAVNQTTADSGIFHNIVHGGINTEVLTENGNVKSIAKVISENEQTLAGSIATLTAMRDEAINSANNAALSENNSATSEVNAANAKAQTLAAVGAVANKYLFDDTIIMDDPTAGVLNFNNVNLSLATNLAISAQTAEITNPDISAFINTWGSSTSIVKGVLTIKKSGAPQVFAIFAVTGAVADNNTWLQIPLTYITGNGVFALSDELYISFSKTGDKGLGDLLAANNLFDLLDIPAARNNLGLGTAALKNTGTAAGTIPLLEAGGKLPAVDASQLLNLPKIIAGRAYAENAAVAACYTIPQITEGSEVISLAYAAHKATNKLRFMFSGSAGSAGNVNGATALFKDSNANAIFSVMKNAYANMYGGASHNFIWETVAGDTAAHSYSVRIGLNSGTAYLNGSSGGGRIHGGAQAANLIIEEIEI